MDEKNFNDRVNEIDKFMKIKKEGVTLTNDEKLNIYAYFKQAKFGDYNPKDEPSIFSINIKEKYKFNAWKKLKGMSKEKAMKNYVEYTEIIIKKYSK